MRKIGVFICHCGLNIAGTVDVEQVAEQIGAYPGVVLATTYKYTCSDPGQQLIRDAIRQHGLDGVVVAACSPAMHELTFRRTAASAGLNPYLVECANIREQCSWVHAKSPKLATHKALLTIQSMVEKVKRNEALDPLSLPLTKRALVIGGGIAGITAALDIADAGYNVVLVERSEHLGGHMAELSGSYLNFEAGPDVLARRVQRVMEHPTIQVMCGAQVTQLDGYVGNFRASVEKTDREEDSVTFDVGAVVVATGYERYPLSRLPEYGGGQVPDVIDALAFERMLAAGADLRRPSDGRVPREVVWVQCAGSRDPAPLRNGAHGVPYCSKVCCMTVAKQAASFKERVPGGQAYVFYIDIRSAGLHYDEYVQRAMQDYRVVYLRGKVSKIFGNGDKVVVWGSDTLSNRAVEIPADLVVLATPMAAPQAARELAQRLHISIDANGFYSEAHPKLRPVESLTAGIFLAGAAQGPKDIPETVGQASAAAAKVLQLFSHDEMKAEPTVAQVIPELCSACGICVPACPYGAREIDTLRRLAVVNAALCQTCGACAAACPNKATIVRNWTPEQILFMADALV
ncbi:MAG: CoB--CoM heterodisulfide reductase iron-sulfur subunit A family protein [Thermoflexales bacterium]|nr:CoB--CoM heterodisulfide reductase iron-sulfur subunit A family protein [Thermoflexales bacterium]